MTRQFDTAEADAGGIDLTDYGRVLWRRKWLVLLCGILGLLGGWFAASGTAETSYTSTSKVYVGPLVASPVATDVSILDEQQVAASYDVAQVVRRNQQIDTLPNDLLAGLSVVGELDSSVLTFTYTANDPAQARALAQGFAEAYLQVREGRERASIQQQIASVRERLKNLKQRLVLAQRDVTEAVPGSIEQQEAELRRDLLFERILPLRTRVDELATLAADSGFVIVPGTEAVQSAESSFSATLVGGGALAGLVIGVLLAFVREAVDDRLHDVVDVKRALPMLPVVAMDKGRRGQRLSGRDRVKSGSTPRVGAYGPLVARLLIAAGDRAPYVLAVTSPVDHWNSRAVSEGLVTSLERAGKRVRLVLGAASLNSGEANDPAEDARGLSPAVVAGVDLVVIVAPPVLAGPEALLHAGQAGGVVLVVTRKLTLHSELNSTMEQLDAVGASIMGVVVVSPGPRRSRRHPANQGETR